MFWKHVKIDNVVSFFINQKLRRTVIVTYSILIRAYLSLKNPKVVQQIEAKD